MSPASTRFRPGTHLRPGVGAAAALAAVCCFGAALLGNPGPSGGTTTIAQARATFLSGSAAGTDLGTVLSLRPARASLPAGPASDLHPLDATVLNAVNVDLGSGVTLFGGAGLASLGAVNQVAFAHADGSALAGAGAVDGTGAVTAGAAASYPSTASVTLTPILARGGPVVSTALSSAGLTTGALTSQARQAAGNNGAQSGTYSIAALNMSLSSPLVAGIGTALTTAAAAGQPAQTAVAALSGTIVLLPGLLGATVTGLPDLAAVLDTALGTGQVSADGGAATLNLRTGRLTIDLAALLSYLHENLNALPANTHLGPLLAGTISTDLATAVSSTLAGLDQALDNSLSGVTVSLGPVTVSPLGYAAAIATARTAIDNAQMPIAAAAASTALSGVGSAVTRLLDVSINNQTLTGGAFSESPLALTVLPGATPLAALQLAASTVGPNAGPAAAPSSSAGSPTTSGSTSTPTGTPAPPTGPESGVGTPVTAITGPTVPLAYTGTPVRGELTLAGLLLAAGSSLLLVRRRPAISLGRHAAPAAGSGGNRHRGTHRGQSRRSI